MIFPWSTASPDAISRLRIKIQAHEYSSSCFYAVLPKKTRWTLQQSCFLSEDRFTKERFTSSDLRLEK